MRKSTIFIFVFSPALMFLLYAMFESTNDLGYFVMMWFYAKAWGILFLIWFVLWLFSSPRKLEQ